MRDVAGLVRAHFLGDALARGLELAVNRRWHVAIGSALLLGACAAALSANPGTTESNAERSPAPVSEAGKLNPEAFAADAPDAPPAHLSDAIQLFVIASGGDSIQQLLLRAGTRKADASKADALLSAAGIREAAEGTEIELLLGQREVSGARRLEGVSLQPGESVRTEIVRNATGGLTVLSRSTAVDAAPRRFAGHVGSGLFWSLRSAGVPADLARQYLDVVGTRLDPQRDLRAEDQFDLVVDRRKSADGKDEFGPLLYAAVRRPGGRSLHLLRWTVGSASGWYEPGKSHQRADGLLQPVSGRLSSRFGTRIHPIFRVGRFHSGVDYAARWGTPVFAAADGVVASAGWNGGYGRQVRLAHQDGLSTSYSHLSQIVVSDASPVRRGDLIGFVGSTGFSTGPHLHYEVHRRGQPVDPMSVSHSTTVALSVQDLASLEARMRQLLSS